MPKFKVGDQVTFTQKNRNDVCKIIKIETFNERGVSKSAMNKLYPDNDGYAYFLSSNKYNLAWEDSTSIKLCNSFIIRNRLGIK